MAPEPTAEVTAHPELSLFVRLPVQPPVELPSQVPDSPEVSAGVPTVEASRWSVALARLEEAERRGASADILQILQETVIAARIAMLRVAERAGTPIDPAARRQLERDRELLRRFPGDRGGEEGVGWFEWPLKT
jgi:hypothetical protein